MVSREPNKRQDIDEGPWYRQGWAWFVLAPILVVIIAWIPFMTIAVKKSDDVVVDNYYKEGRMYNMRLDQDRLASELQVSGDLVIDHEVGEVLVNLSLDLEQSQVPAALILHLDHPMEADNDLDLQLRRVYDGRFVGELPHRLQHRWYVRLEPVIQSEGESADRNQWRITGEMDLSQSSRLVFGANE